MLERHTPALILLLSSFFILFLISFLKLSVSFSDIVYVLHNQNEMDCAKGKHEGVQPAIVVPLEYLPGEARNARVVKG